MPCAIPIHGTSKLQGVISSHFSASGHTPQDSSSRGGGKADRYEYDMGSKDYFIKPGSIGYHTEFLLPSSRLSFRTLWIFTYFQPTETSVRGPSPILPARHPFREDLAGGLRERNGASEGAVVPTSDNEALAGHCTSTSGCGGWYG